MNRSLWRERWRQAKAAILVALASWIGFLALKFLTLTVRISTLHKERVTRFWDRGQRVTVAFWHGRLCMMPMLKEPGRRYTTLISSHRDGEYITRAVKRLGISVVRGSTTRGSLSGVKGLLRAFRDGSDLVITPDGPQGPKEIVQPGVIELARVTGAPICPVTFSASRKRLLKSWDSFLIPAPFSRGIFFWGEPLEVPRRCTREERERLRLKLEERMRQMNAVVDKYFDRT